MDKIERLRELFQEINTLQEEKNVVVREQRYEDAANLRDKERKLIRQIDELVGHQGYYMEMVRMEEAIFHLNSIEESINRLKKLNIKLEEGFLIEIDSKSLLELQQKRIKIQDELLNFNVNLGLQEKKFEKKF